MTRPQILRADTIDLQDQDSPSAKDHTRQHARPGVRGDGSPAPHQAEALRHVELELSEQHGRSPRASQDLSGKELQLLHDEDVAHDRDPTENLLRNSALQNGGMGSDDEMDAMDGEEVLDDEMDKISSSPSIDESGRCLSPLASAPPGRFPRVFQEEVPSGPTSNTNSSSPFVENHEQQLSIPLEPRYQSFPSSTVHHHQHPQGLYPQDTSSDADARRAEIKNGPGSSAWNSGLSPVSEEFENLRDTDETDFNPDDFHHLLLPTNDPLLDDINDEGYYEEDSTRSSSPSTESDISWDNDSKGHDDDDTMDVSFVDDSRFVDSGWGGECLREAEEIDFDFVYALHTFVATVEGQANATKGDNMVLLDDSNSYWWLVRVVKDSSIGYLPAEHIETPTERLARLNKHRNQDLSTMILQDHEEDKKGSLNPLKKAMRRRNVKTVQFAPPSYVEPSDNGATSDEEEDALDEDNVLEQDNVEQEASEPAGQTIENGVVESAKPQEPHTNGIRSEPNASDEVRTVASVASISPEKPRNSEETLVNSEDGSVSRSRKGNVRNTDSFFKDESLETRKINLTPSLLRDDSSSVTARSSDSTLKNRPSLDSLGKDTPSEKGKEDKKKKEKRGVLGGMFKRRDRKSKSQERDVDESEKNSGELRRQSPQPKESLESLTQELKASPQPHRQTSKLQKQPPAKLSPKSSYQQQREPAAQKPLSGESDIRPVNAEPSRLANSYNEPNGHLGSTQSELQPRKVEEPPLHSRSQIREVTPIDSSPSGSHDERRRELSPPSKGFGKVQPLSARTEPDGRVRIRADEVESSSGNEGSTRIDTRPERGPYESQAEGALRKGVTADQHHLAVAQAAQNENSDVEAEELTKTRSDERLSESPVQILPAEVRQQEEGAPQQRRTPHQPPPLVADTSSTEEPSTTSPISPSSSPELIERPTDEGEPGPAVQAPGMSRDVLSNDTASTNSSSEEKMPSPRKTTAPVPDPITTPASTSSAVPADNEQPTPTSTATSNTTASAAAMNHIQSAASSPSPAPTWSPAHLRTYLSHPSSDTDMRDLLLLVMHDRSGLVVPQDPGKHPVVGKLYKEEKGRLEALEDRLDGLLGNYMTRKKGGPSPVGSPGAVAAGRGKRAVS